MKRNYPYYGLKGLKPLLNSFFLHSIWYVLFWWRNHSNACDRCTHTPAHRYIHNISNNNNNEEKKKIIQTWSLYSFRMFSMSRICFDKRMHFVYQFFFWFTKFQFNKNKSTNIYLDSSNVRSIIFSPSIPLGYRSAIQTHQTPKEYAYHQLRPNGWSRKI